MGWRGVKRGRSGLSGGVLAALGLVLGVALPAAAGWPGWAGQALEALQGDCPGAPGQPPETLPGAESFTYADQGRPLRIHVLAPPGGGGSAPGVLLVEAGPGSLLPQAQRFAAAGYVAALADYRVHCRDGTGPEAALADATNAWAWFRVHAARLGADPGRLMLAGGARGGAVALQAALGAPPDEKPRALVLFEAGADHGRALTEAAARPLAGLPPALLFGAPAPARAFCTAATVAGRDCAVADAAPGGRMTRALAFAARHDG